MVVVLRAGRHLARRVRMSGVRRLFVTLLLVHLVGVSSHAFTIVPMSIEDLASTSVGSIIGTVRDIRVVQNVDGMISTLIRIDVDALLSGVVPAPTIVLKEDGGVIDDIMETIDGAPSFEGGEHVVVFLTTRPDGS